MKDYKKYIFDIDYTILIPDWSKEDDYFKKHILENEQEEFFKNKQSILNKYEQEFPRYNTKTLSDYFKSYGFTVSEDTINGWMIYNGETIKDEVVDGVVDLFKYLKENNKDVTFYCVEHADHGGAAFWNNQVLEITYQFLKEHIKK